MMKIKHLFLAVFYLFMVSSFAQEYVPVSKIMGQSTVLVWTPVEYASKYRLIIRKDSTTIVDTFLKETEYDFSALSPGKYQYRVIAYNLLNKPASESEWTDLIIKKTVRPEAGSFSPAGVILRKNEQTQITLDSRWKYPQNSRFVFVPENDQESHIEPQAVEKNDDNSVTLTLPKLIGKNYKIRLINPEGVYIDADMPLSVTNSIISDKRGYIHLGWEYSIFLHGKLKQYLNNKRFFPFNFFLDLGGYVYKTEKNHLGLGLGVQFDIMPLIKQPITPPAQYLSFSFSHVMTFATILYMYDITPTLSIGLDGKIGFTASFTRKDEQQSSESLLITRYRGFALYTKVEGFFRYIFYKGLYLQVHAGYQYTAGNFAQGSFRNGFAFGYSF